MERKLLFAILFILLSTFTCLSYAFHSYHDSPVGYWKIIDALSGKPKSIVYIWRTQENELKGKIIKVFAQEVDKTIHLCTRCTGKNLNQPIVGMVILSGLRLKEKQWRDGAILNPENGKTYSCNLRTMENGKKLQVRNYMGLPLLGKSEIWERVDLI